MAQALSAALRIPVTDRATGEAWISALFAAKLAFHFEDDPADIIHVTTNEETFLDSDLDFLREQVAALYDLEWDGYDCPIGFLLAVMAFAGDVPVWDAGEEVEFGNGLIAKIVSVGASPEMRAYAVLRFEGRFMMAVRDMGQYATGDFSDVFEERNELFPDVQAAWAALATKKRPS